MTFKDRYDVEISWSGKVQIMEIYHLAMCHREQWSLIKTASYFECSIGLVSENLKLALAIHSNERILDCDSRQEALKSLNGGRNGTLRPSSESI